MNRLRSLFLVLFFLPSLSSAQWTKTLGPSEVSATALAADGSSLFLGTGGSGLFVSSNSGLNWGKVWTYPDSTGTRAIKQIINHFGTMFVSTSDKIYSSSDIISWTDTTVGLPDTLFDYNIYQANGELFATGLALDYTTIVNYTRLYHYNNISSHWEELPNLPLDPQVLSVAAIRDTFYFAVLGHGIYKTYNNGSTWDSITTANGLTTKNIRLLATDTSHIYAYGYAGSSLLFASPDGVVWTSRPFGVIVPTPINTMKVQSDSLIIGVAGGIYISHDGGNSWHFIFDKYYDFRDLVFYNSIVFAADANMGVLATHDTAWSPRNNNLTYSVNYKLAKPFGLLYAVNPISTFHTADQGHFWNYDTSLIYELADVCRMGNKAIGFSAFGQTNLASWNQGATWHIDAGSGVRIRVRQTLVDNAHHKIYVLGDGDVRRSDDYGVTWKSLFYANPAAAGDTVFTSIARIKNRLFVTIHDTSDQLLVSDDFGDHWARLTFGAGVAVYHVASIKDSVLVMSTATGIQMTPDAGNSILSVSPSGKLYNTYTNGSLLFNYNDTLIEYSQNYGATWTNISPVRDSIGAIYSLLMDADFLYIGTAGNSVWRDSIGPLHLAYTPDTSNNYVLPNDVPYVSASAGFELKVFPNPFASSANVALELVENSVVDLKLYDALGRCISAITQGTYGTGLHVFHLEPSLPAGIYFVVADVNHTRAVRQIIHQ